MVELNPTPLKALDRLLQLLRQGSQQFEREVQTHPAKAEALPRLTERQFSNVFGLMGPRGAGKSTLLFHLFDQYQDNPNDKRFQGLRLLEPLDCSVVMQDVPPGTAILLHVLGELDRVVELQRKNGAGGTVQGNAAELRRLAAQYSEASAAYQQLCAELSASSSDYTELVLEGLQHRLELKRKLSGCLEKVRPEFGAQTQALVVLLDDFDLIPARSVRTWMLSILDELHQGRLLFVLTADFHRLGHLSWDARQGFDDKTGQALLAKFLPPQNRVQLQPWALNDRKEFSQPAPGLGLVDDGQVDPTYFSGKPDCVLGQQVKRFSFGRRSLEVLLNQLLPSWPRGLVDLHHSLQQFPRNLSAAVGISQKTEKTRDEKIDKTRDDLRKFLALLAGCRQEPYLSRALEQTGLSAWVHTLRFKAAELTLEEWRENVGRACQRCRGGLEVLAPLSSLVPAWPDGSEPAAEQSQETVRKRASSEAVRLAPGWVDPLRHDEVRILPLRDADESSSALWAELLINFGLREVGDLQAEARSRAHFVSSWVPANARLERAVFHLELSRRGFRDFLEGLEAPVPRAVLLWLEWRGKEPGGDEVLRIGWPPLFQGLRSNPAAALARISREFLLAPQLEQGSLPPADGTALRLLPDEVWAIVLLVDGLDRCPWEAFSGPLGWLVGTSVGLAAAFVRSAYAQALAAGGVVRANHFSKPQQELIKVLEDRDPSRLQEKDEEDVVALLNRLFADGLEAKLRSKDSLTKATQAYLESPIYISVVEMLKGSILANGK